MQVYKTNFWGFCQKGTGTHPLRPKYFSKSIKIWRTNLNVRLVFAVFTVLSLAASIANCEIKTLTYQVSAGADDGYAWSPTEQDISSGHLMIGDDNVYTAPYYMSAMRFSNVAIPRNASIVEAHLKIRSISEGFRGQIYGLIQAESADNATDFSSRYIASAVKTSAAVSWDHKFAWDDNTWQTSPDISSTIQEVISRLGWNSANNLALFYSTRADSGKSRMFAAFDSAPASAAILELTYETYSISGYVRTDEGVGAEGVTISAGSDIEGAVTNATGYYELQVPPGWSGSVTPSKAQWGFNPGSRPYSNVTTDQINQDFTAFQPKISGYVRDNSGTGIVGVAVSADNGGGSDTTDAVGYYEITVPYNWSGTVTPQKLGWQFTPSGHNYTNVTTNQEDQDFSADYVGFTVRKDGSGDYISIQAAIDAVPVGHTITVAQDVYYENINFKGKNIILRSTEPNDPNVVANTIIDGQNSGSVVTFSGTETEDCILAGLTITDGNAGYRAHGGGILGNSSMATIVSCVVSGNAAEWGAGIAKCAGEIIDCRISNNFARTSGAGLCDCFGTIRDCNITQNTADAWGGGLINCGTIVNCVFSENSAGIGGGLYGGNTVINCLISSNTASYGAGLAHCDGTVEDCEIVDNNSNAFFECDGTVTNCVISRNSAGNGGGFRDCSITINNCTISENYARSRGGGLFNCNGLVTDSTISHNTAGIGGGVYGGRATITNCTISDNSAEDGGGLISYSGNISNSTISNNSATDDGGGLRQCDGTIFNCTISGNSAGYRGGALDWCDGTISHCMITGNTAYRAVGIAWCDGVVENCVVMNNTATSYGGGIFSSMATIQNCTVVGNSAAYCAGLDNCDGPIRNCIVWGNTGTQVCGSSIPSYSCIQGWTSGGTDNFSANPLFLPDGYHISGGSPCIDAGDPNYVSEPNETDIDSHQRVVGRIDAGADEFYSPNAPLLHLPNRYLEFTALQGRSNPPPQNITIKNYGLPDLSWVASTECAWLAVDPPAGVASFLVGSSTAVSADITGMTEGIYTCTVTISDIDSNDSPQTVDVNLHVIGPILAVSPNDFSFAATLENRTPAAQTLSIYNDGGGTLNWQVSVANDCNWLTAVPISGEATAEVDEVALSVDASNLSFGFYACEITVSDPNAENHLQQVSVSLQVDWPIISASPAEFNFIAATNNPYPPNQILNISNIGVDTLRWHISIPNDCNWLSADPMTGDSNGDVNHVVLSVNAAGLRGGPYACGLTVSDPNAENNPQTIPVNLHVNGPVISLSTNSIEFRHYLQGPNSTPQLLYISNAGVDVLDWQITIPSGCDWLNIYPLTGQSTGDVNEVLLSVDANGLAQGFYTCDLIVSDLKAENSPQTVQVILRIMMTEGHLYVPTEFPTIQAAIDAAFDGNEVIVEPGTYTGQGNRDIDFLGKAITVRSLDPNNTDTVTATIVDCNYQAAGFIFENYEDANSILNGLTVRRSGGTYHDSGIWIQGSSPTIVNCYITESDGAAIRCRGAFGTRLQKIIGCVISDNAGPAVSFMYGSLEVTDCVVSGNGGGIGGYNKYGGTFTVTNCIIMNNSVEHGGGGISVSSSSPMNTTISNCIITGNSTGYDGGGIELYIQGDITVTNCTITANSAGLEGGGISCILADPDIVNCTIAGNTTLLNGGGLYCYHSLPRLTNCTITGNSAQFGGAIYSYSGDPILTNCTLADNTALNGSTLACDADQYSSPSSIQMTNSILWDEPNQIWNNDDSTITITYSDVYGGYPGLGNIDADPCFALPGYWHPNSTPDDVNDDFWLEGDYHLKSQAGRWSPSMYTQLDPTGDGFVNLTDFAAFADYWQQTGSFLPADLDHSGTVDFNDLTLLLENYLTTYDLGAWVYDDVTSGAIDAGNPGCPLGDEPDDPNNLRINMGAYGGTPEASATPPDWAFLADLNNDLVVDTNDLSVFVDYWLETGTCLPSDLNRDGVVNSTDYAIFAENW